MYYKTTVFGEHNDTVVIETAGKRTFEIPAKDAIVKLWFSDGTILGIKYSTTSKIWKDMWKIRVLCNGDRPWVFRQINTATLSQYSDEYTVEADLVNYKVIPRTHYSGDDMDDAMV